MSDFPQGSVLFPGVPGLFVLFANTHSACEAGATLRLHTTSLPLERISGELVVVIRATGEEGRIKAGDFFDIPPGHTGFIPGNERCEMALFAAGDPTR